MKVGVVVYDGLDNTSGGFTYDRHLVAHLREQGDSVEILTLPWRSYPRCLLDGVRPTLRRRLAGEFDVLLQDELCHPSLLGVNHRLDDDSPIVSIVHHLRASERHPYGLGTFYRQLERAYLRTVDGAVCPSAATAETVEDLCEVPTAVARPGGDRFDLAVDRADVRERAGTDPFRVLFLGNIVPRKNVETLLRAVARLSPPPQTTIVGDQTADESYTRTLRDVRRRLGLKETVTFTGRLADPAVAEHLTRTHLLVVPSTYEGFGMVYLEAMAAGVPAVATTAGGPREVVTDAENGLLVPPDDPDAVAEAIETLREDRDRLEDLSMGALRRFERHPTWADSMATAREFLTTLVGADAPKVTPEPKGDTDG